MNQRLSTAVLAGEMSLTPRQTEALKALASGPGGIRKAAYPSAMATLVELGFVRESLSKTRPRQPIWLLTIEGRRVGKWLLAREPAG